MSAAQPTDGQSRFGKTVIDLTGDSKKPDNGSTAAATVPDQRMSLVDQTSRLVDQAGLLASRLGVPLLRVTLGLVYVWFGVLKMISRSDVFSLVAGTLPFLNPYVFVPALGVIEVLLGLGLVFGRMPRLVFILVLAHLAGTFLTIFTVPNMLWHSHDPLLLSMDGEFVLKNLVLISAVLVLLGVASRIRLGSGEGSVARRT
jgi:uncharacterized membrane protein YkgB